jgi:hypothetical protein
MTQLLKVPTLNGTAFNCPHCAAYARQHWNAVSYKSQSTGYMMLKNWSLAMCDHCGEPSIWQDDAMRYPAVATAPLPNDDLPPEIKTDYLKARDIAVRSPRGAAALLRLAIQKLFVHLGEKGKNINDDIASLVAKGLPAAVQKSLDVVRVIGNEAVHPGEIDLRDDQTIVNMLFRLVNLISEKMITEPKTINEIYEILPPEKREQIERRDKPK